MEVFNIEIPKSNFQRKNAIETQLSYSMLTKLNLVSAYIIFHLTLFFSFYLIALNYSAQFYWPFNRQTPDAKGKYALLKTLFTTDISSSEKILILY